MSDKKIGFIGCGNMAQAMISGILKSGFSQKDKICASAKTELSLEKVKADFAINVKADNKEVAAWSDCLILAVKPQIYYKVIDEIKSFINENNIIITIAAGQKVKQVEDAFAREIKLVRTMPNTPSLVGEGMTAMCPNSNMTDGDIAFVKGLLSSFGRAEIVGEYMMDAVTAVSGSSPAYVFMMLEAMADAAVGKGMPREMAYTFAAQAVLGSAKLLLDTGEHPAKLKDMVCSPAGSTIEAVKVLEESGFRAAIMDAMDACARRSSEM